MKSEGAKDFAKLGRERCEGFINGFLPQRGFCIFFVYWDGFLRSSVFTLIILR
ncbi:hypothetical protein IscW_ISCW006324 [Ixodes scapularis]|uniref:Uncharacterized protein n=1 Tax=Ixodes scapularis TaxID=6945 RepID=B7PMY4_IXOSC|nr:hypothetical protein IscW_ISCW006324 [Ixodes scapularis]|eukprot:XP_002435132.1 hypothetical protein IscW_ISCW006324 [Ixodes scapularis]